MVEKITLSNIKQFLQGNLRMFANSLGKYTKDYISLPVHIQEQVFYRSTKCPDCKAIGECINCGCSVPGKWFADKACKEKRYPDMMLKKQMWENYKKENGIKIKLNVHDNK